MFTLRRTTLVVMLTSVTGFICSNTPTVQSGEAGNQTPPAVKLSTTETLLGKQFHGGDQTIVISRDLRRVAYVLNLGRHVQLVVDGVAGKEYTSVLGDSICFSPDSTRVAYVAGRDKKRIAVIDGVEGKEYDFLQRIVFSPDSKHVAYDANRAGKAVLVLDGVEAKEEHEEITGIVFSQDSKRFAYWAISDKKARVVVDGSEEKDYSVIDSEYYNNPNRDRILFSADSQHYAYVVKREAGTSVVSDGVAGKPYASVTFPVFSSDSKRLLSTATLGKQSFAVVDGTEGKYYDGAISSPVFSADSKHFAYVIKKAITPQGDTTGGQPRPTESFVVMDDVEGKKYDSVAGLIFAGDPQQVAYMAVRGKKQLVVSNGAEGKEYDAIWQIVRNAAPTVAVFQSPDSRHIVYFARRGEKWLCVLDGAEGKEYDAIGHEGYDGPVFSPDSKRIAYLATRGGKYVAVIDGAEGKEYNRIQRIVFSPDSKRSAYIGKRGQISVAVVDGVEGAEYPDILDPVSFSPDSRHFAYLTDSYAVVDGVECGECDRFLIIEYFRVPKLVFDSPTKLHTLSVRRDKVYRIEVEIAQ